jgi:hypothetical protein
MSLIRPVILMYPSGSMIAMSPVCIHPAPSITSAVFSGWFQYPVMTLYPRVHNSPGVSRGSCSPVRGDAHSCAHGYPRPSDVEVAQLTDSREAGAPADNEWG